MNNPDSASNFLLGTNKERPFATLFLLIEKPVFRIRIRKSLDLQDPNLLGRGTDLDPDQDPSSIKQKLRETKNTLICRVLFCDLFMTFYQ